MNKKQARIRRATKSRMKMKELGATRLVVNRTPRHIYAQVISADGEQLLGKPLTTLANYAQSNRAIRLTTVENQRTARLLGQSILGFPPYFGFLRSDAGVCSKKRLKAFLNALSDW